MAASRQKRNGYNGKSNETHSDYSTKVSDINVHGILDRVLNLPENEIFKICSDAKSRFNEHPELIISDVENIRRFQNETGQKILNFDLNTEDGFTDAVNLLKMLLGGSI